MNTSLTRRLPYAAPSAMRHSSEICAYKLLWSCSSPIQNPLRPVDERNGTLKFGSRYLECRSLNFWVTKNAVLGHSIGMKILDGIVRPRHMLEYQCRNFCPLLHANPPLTHDNILSLSHLSVTVPYCAPANQRRASARRKAVSLRRSSSAGYAL